LFIDKFVYVSCLATAVAAVATPIAGKLAGTFPAVRTMTGLFPTQVIRYGRAVRHDKFKWLFVGRYVLIAGAVCLYCLFRFCGYPVIFLMDRIFGSCFVKTKRYICIFAVMIEHINPVFSAGTAAVVVFAPSLYFVYQVRV
jgi:hypothetical protein